MGMIIVNKISVEELSELELFKNLKPETLLKLSTIGVKVAAKKGQHIFRDKDEVNTVYIVLKGKISLYKLSENSSKKVIFILGRDKIINEVILDDLPSSINCEIFEDGELLTFNRLDFLELMKVDFDLTVSVVNSLSIKVRRLYRQLKNTTPLKIEKKVAAKLWKLAKDYGVSTEEGTLINLNITITYLADLFGSQRETVSRALGQLESLKLIKFSNKKIVIIDKDKLSLYFKGL